MFLFCLLCFVLVSGSCFPLVLCTVTVAMITTSRCHSSGFISPLVAGPTSQLLCDLLCAENKFLLNSHLLHICHICPHQSPSSFHTFALHTVQLVSMTSGLSPWRTNLAFHSGSKRKVSFSLFLALISYLCVVSQSLLSWIIRIEKTLL